MTKRSSKPHDLNSMAAAIVGQSVDPEDEAGDPIEQKDPVAVESGKKGGKARAAKLTAEERSDIARRAAEARWGH
jgi:hypothetical protein